MEDNPPLATLARLDYMAQFAILNQKLDSPLFVGLLNVEHRLLDNYEFFFGEKFGSVIHGLWMNFCNLQDPLKKHRWFYLKDYIPQTCELIKETSASVQEIIHAQAQDNAGQFVNAISETVRKVKFFSRKKEQPHPQITSMQSPLLSLTS
jgi:hypothetical protein